MKTLFKRETKQIIKLLETVPAPSSYDIDRCKLAAMKCRSTKEFAEFLEVDELVFKHWVNTNKAFAIAYRSWREYVTDKVEFALAKRATGFTKRTVKQILNRQGQVVDLVTEEYFPPSETAAGLWLKNRRKEDWKETQQIDVNVQANIRAWLVNAMSDSDRDETEIIDVTPQLISEPDTVGTQEPPLISQQEPKQEIELEPILEPEKEPVSQQGLGRFQW